MKPSIISTASSSGEPLGERLRLTALIALTLLFVVQSSRTHRVFNDTADEEVHIACGLQVWQTGRYDIEYQHPPLARMILAYPAWRAGLRHRHGQSVSWTAGDPEFYWRTLIWARRANLLFAPMLLFCVYRWGRELHGPRAGLAAAALVSFSPNLLAHASLATLDFGAAVTILVALYYFWRWSRQPGLRWCVWAAVAFGIATLTKFSALFVVPPVAAVFFLLARYRDAPWRPTRRWVQAAGRGAVFAVVTVVVIWAGYLFHTGPWAPPQIYPARGGYLETFEHAAQRIAAHQNLPAPGFPRGIQDVLAHNSQGHAGYLLGQIRDTGWWYYFPVALAVKTTLPLLLLVALSLVFRARANLGLLLAAAIVLAVSMLGNLNMGIRHILVLYPLAALIASALFCGRRVLLAAAAALTLWHAVESVAAHPDYLAYFNQIARGREDRFLLDSNLDWGQDLERLRQYLESNKIPNFYLFYFGRADPAHLGMTGIIERLDSPRLSGWLAVSRNNLAGLTRRSNDLAWLKRHTPVARVGKSILVYHFPEEVEHGIRPGRVAH